MWEKSSSAVSFSNHVAPLGISPRDSKLANLSTPLEVLVARQMFDYFTIQANAKQNTTYYENYLHNCIFSKPELIVIFVVHVLDLFA